MARKQREDQLHEILLDQGGREQLIALLEEHKGSIDNDLDGTSLVDAILAYEFPPDKLKAAGDEKFDAPLGTEAPGG